MNLGSQIRHRLLPESPRQAIVSALWLVIVLLMVLSLVSFVAWRRDLAEIRETVAAEIDEDAPPDQIVESAREFLEHKVGYGRPDAYFMLPVFRFMRPTALQVIKQGGDCGYRTRVFVVILKLFDIEADKHALYNSEGRPVHAVAEVQTERGPYYVDLLFNVAHVDEQGRPLSLEQLSNEDVLRRSIGRAVAAGNARATGYPFEHYDFKDVRTINWHKNVFTEAAYDLLVLVAGEDKAKNFPRPYLSEEPALMVIVLSSGTCVVLLIFVWGLSRRGKAIAARSVEREA